MSSAEFSYLKATKRHSAEQAIVAKDDIVPEGRGPNINYTLLAEAMRPIRRLLVDSVHPGKVQKRLLSMPLSGFTRLQNERPTCGQRSPASFADNRNKLCEIRGIAGIDLESNVL
jgi:hypothetical protein